MSGEKSDQSGTAALVGKLGGAGTTVGGLNLATLLFIGWQAKGAFDEQFEQLDKARTEFVQKTGELEQKLTELSKGVDAISSVSSNVAALQAKVSQIEVELAKLEAEIDKVEDCAKDKRKCDP